MKAKPKAKKHLSRAEVYQKLFEFNLHIQQGIDALLGLERAKEVSVREVRRIVACFEEFRADASGYLAGVISECEDQEAGRLFLRRRRRDMAEDSKAGWKRKGKRSGRRSRGRPTIRERED